MTNSITAHDAIALIERAIATTDTVTNIRRVENGMAIGNGIFNGTITVNEDEDQVFVTWENITSGDSFVGVIETEGLVVRAIAAHDAMARMVD